MHCNLTLRKSSFQYSITCFQQNGQSLYPSTSTNCQLITSIIKTNDKTNQVSIIPNPASNNLTIETNINTKQNIEIFNIVGQSIYTSNINSKATVDVSAFAKGVYIIKLTRGKETIVKKFIKQ